MKKNYAEEIAGFRLIDDVFMNVVFHQRNKETSELLQIILDNPSIKVKTVIAQSISTNLHGRSTRFDIEATDSTGKLYDIEIQRANGGASEKRARFNCSRLDSSSLERGETNWDKLPESYVIFITENDYFRENKPIYYIHRVIENLDNREFQDGQHILYVNASYKNDGSKIGKLIHDLWCENPDEMYSKIFAKRVKYFKQEKEGFETMCETLDRLQKEAVNEQKREALKSAVKLIRKLKPSASDDFIIDEISKEFKAPKKEVKKFL